MASPSRFTKIKVVFGYLVLLSVLFLSLLFVSREVENLATLDTEQHLKSDSLLLLLRQKDENAIDMLRALNEVNEKYLSIEELEEIIASQDTAVEQQRVQYKVVTKRDSVITPVRKKAFFKRLAEAFVPPKDTTVLVNTTQEQTTDTLLHEYNPADSLEQKVNAVKKRKEGTQRVVIRKDDTKLRELNSMLTARIDSLVLQYEEAVANHAQTIADNQQAARQRSTLIVAGVAVGAVILSMLFLSIIWRDITRSNRYRKKLEKANKRAEELLQAREKLMLTITHDFKAPLGSIIGYADLLSHLTVDERQRFYLDNMRSSSSHLLRLVNDLLDFHRLDLNKMEVKKVPFTPTQLFDEIHTSFQPLADHKGLTLKYEISSGLINCYMGDPLRIRQIVTNLLSNAIKFTNAGSVHLRVRYDNAMLTIAVQDTGKGMAPKDQERIFQEFTRLPDAQGEEGFGLGLSIVAKLVVLLEGVISVKSSEGKGSTFTVSIPLPRAKAGVKAIASDEKKEAPLYDKNLRVLLIDDDKIQLRLTSAMLEQGGIYSVCCDQPDELIEYLREETFDLLLTDVQMPAINGFDLLKLLRASNISQAQTIPVIAVTARSEMNKEDFIGCGFAGLLKKPFSVKELLAVVGLNVLPAEDAKQGSSSSSPNFKALTAFSEGDEEAARSIVNSFLSETEKNAETIHDALLQQDVDGIAAMSHKLLPLFTLIEASEVTSLLAWLEGQRGKPFSEEIEKETKKALEQIYKVISLG